MIDLFGVKPKTESRKTRIKAVTLGFLGASATSAVATLPAYAQSTTSTMDMTPLVSVIVAIIPVFIMIALLDKLLGKFSR